MLKCSFGVAPSVFVAAPIPGTPMVLSAMPAGTIMDILPTNVPPFGMCQSMSNPAVASATAAAMGALTPMPCTPVISAPWAPPAVAAHTRMLPVATVDSKCMCAFGGVISVSAPLPGPMSAT
jgi:hypothetical protein